MCMPLVSIIVPIYKVESYLRRCLDSVISQTYVNLEIILVDDGSPDNCPQICDEYAEKDKRVVVIHKKNGGLSDARNAGLDICKGEYISFVDSDDWIDEKYIEILFNLLQTERADIAIINHQQFYDDNCLLPEPAFEDAVYDGRAALKKLIVAPTIQLILSWGKLYKKELFFNLRFPKNKFNEDQYTSYLLFFSSKKIVCKIVIAYHYLKRDDSIMGTLKYIDYSPIEEEQANFFYKHQIYDLAFLLYYRLCWTFLQKYCLSSNGSDFLVKERSLLKRLSTIKQKPILKFYILKIASCFPLLYKCYKVLIK